MSSVQKLQQIRFGFSARKSSIHLKDFDKTEKCGDTDFRIQVTIYYKIEDDIYATPKVQMQRISSLPQFVFT